MLDSYALTRILSRLASYPSATDSPEPGGRAAVAAILREAADGETEILLVRRAERPGDPWSGHMALPGGRRSDEDTTLLDTAIRETREEVGIDLAQRGELVARLPDVPAVARGKRIPLVIAPFIFALKGAPDVAVNHEIAEAIWTPLGPLARGERAGTFAYEHDGVTFDLPYLDVGGRRVWGLTYQMLQHLFSVLHH